MNDNEIDKAALDLMVKIWLEHFMNKPHNLSESDAGFLLNAYFDQAKKETQ
jgi:hypothetical protein